ncbi:hypothetical protein B7P43_G04698, partial [Cryptotermes secundus]
IILPVVLYGCGTLSPSLREEHRLRTSERIYGPKRDEVIGGWKKLHNEELHNFYSSPGKIRMIKSRRIGWARMGYTRTAYRILVGKDGMNCIDLVQDRDQWMTLGNTVMNLQVL